MKDYISIGYTKKTHGTKGHLKIKVNNQYLEDFAQAEVLFFEVKGKLVPHFIEDINFGHQVITKFEDIDSREAATYITAKEIFLRTKDILADKDRELEVVETLAFAKYINYTLIDTEQGSIGKIEEIVEYPQQEMAVVIYKNKEILIPLNQQLINSIDDKKQTILLDLPEGLLDL